MSHWELIKLRKRYNLSQKKMSEILEISEDSYGKKERRKAKFDIEELFKIRFLFNKPLEEIFLPQDFAKLDTKEMKCE